MKINSLIRFGLFVTVSLLTVTSYAQEGDKNVKQKLTDEKGNTYSNYIYQKLYL